MAKQKHPNYPARASVLLECAWEIPFVSKFEGPVDYSDRLLVILFDAAFPRQRSKAPGEQRFAAVVSDGDHLLQPEPLVCLTEQLRNHRHRWPQHSLPSGRYSLTWGGLVPAGSHQLCLRLEQPSHRTRPAARGNARLI